MAWALTSRQQTAKRAEPKPHKAGEGLASYVTALGSVVGTAALSSWLEPHTQLEDLAMIYLLGIVLSSMLCSLRLAVVVACIMVVDFNYFFVPPPFAFAAAELKHALTSVVLVLVAVVVASLQQGLRRQESAVRRSELEAETERARSSLLSAVSHDLKTPLAAILAAGTTLLERHRDLDEATREELIDAVVQETERLSRLVHDLLSVTRLESPGIVLNRSAESLEEIVTVALQRFEPGPPHGPVRVDLPKGLPLVYVDPTLVEELLINLMENCARYAGPQSPIEINASAENDHVTVSVADRGPGVAEPDRERVFEKFYRGKNASTAEGGMGLGLAICRSIVFAHGGHIALRGRDGGGALVELTLPTLLNEPQRPNDVKVGAA